MIALRLVPKVLNAVTQIWAPNAYIISFKLETDVTMLEQKARDALRKYGHQVCFNYYTIIIFHIGNISQNCYCISTYENHFYIL